MVSPISKAERKEGRKEGKEREKGGTAHEFSGICSGGNVSLKVSLRSEWVLGVKVQSWD